eukprot:scaffold75397_cov67-Cyclotella_meneghiniana.AAC.1
MESRTAKEQVPAGILVIYQRGICNNNYLCCILIMNNTNTAEEAKFTKVNQSNNRDGKQNSKGASTSLYILVIYQRGVIV